MTQNAAAFYDSFDLFVVHMQVLNVHEMMKLENRLNKIGRVLFQGSLPGADDKYRPTIRSAIFLVAVLSEDFQRFKAMKFLDREMSSRISYFQMMNS